MLSLIVCILRIEYVKMNTSIEKVANKKFVYYIIRKIEMRVFIWTNKQNESLKMKC